MNELLLRYLKLAAQDDKVAFTRFAEIIGGRIMSIAFRITRDKMHSEDVLNIVLFKTWENIDKIVKLKSPIGYINTIAYNAALDIKRKARDLPLFENVPQRAEDDDLRIDVETALSRLNADEREVVLYHNHAGYSFRQIALLMNSTKKVVYLKYKRAVGKLEKSLSEYKNV